MIVVTVEFPNEKHLSSASHLENLFLQEIDSYFRQVSYNQCWLDVSITKKWYQLQKDWPSYGLESGQNLWSSAMSFVQEVVWLVESDVDFSRYKHIVIVHAAKTRSAWGFPTSMKLGSRGGQVTVWASIIPEQQSVGVFAHEVAHIVAGLPDLYVQQGSRKVSAVGRWDLMDLQYPLPPGFSAWSMIKAGWISPQGVVTLTQTNITVTVEPVEEVTSGIQAIKVPLVQDRYYLIEVRQKIGIGSRLLDYGVMIYLVDESKTSQQGILIAVDGTADTATLDDATFDLREGKQPAYFDKENDISVVVLHASELSRVIFVGPVRQGEKALAESRMTHA
jgi:M6 family metalloprotease-like protein